MSSLTSLGRRSASLSNGRCYSHPPRSATDHPCRCVLGWRISYAQTPADSRAGAGFLVAVVSVKRAVTCSFAGGGIIPRGPLLIPNHRGSTVVAASHLQFLADLSHGSVELEWNDDARGFKAALDVQRPVAVVADTGAT